MIRAALLACAMLGVMGAFPAHAQRSAAECEKISDAHAYNRCLAAAGPASRASAAEPAARSSRTRASEARPSSRRAVRSRTNARRDVNVRRLPSGRMRMEITAPRRR
jgi:hypothetical protein